MAMGVIMYNYYYYYNGINYKRVDKKEARRLFEKGVSIHLLASKMKPFTNWTGVGVVIDNDNDSDFQKVVNQFQYYNCSSETGKAIHYYVAD